MPLISDLRPIANARWVSIITSTPVAVGDVLKSLGGRLAAFPRRPQDVALSDFLANRARTNQLSPCRCRHPDSAACFRESRHKFSHVCTAETLLRAGR